MKTIVVNNPGPDYRLEVGTAPKPVAKGHDVLIKVYAIGLNRADLFQAEGNYNPPPGAPETLGLEVAGEVVAIGEEVKSHAVGNKVCALIAGGAYAEYALAPEWCVLPVPSGLSMEQAACLPEALATVYLNLFELGRLAPMESVLVHGGASGIGVMAIQLAASLGSTVYATAGSDEKCALCESLGAKKAINYKTDDFVARIKEMGGVEVVLDMVGGSYVQKNFSVLKPRGRLLEIAFLEGNKAEVNFGPMLVKNLSMQGSTLRNRSDLEKYQLMQALRTVAWPLVEEGLIKPVIDSTYVFEKADEAHRRMRSYSHAGKIILTL